MQDRLKSKVSGFQDAQLDAMIDQGLTSEERLSRTTWFELSEETTMPRMMVQALLEACNSSALIEAGGWLVKHLLLTCLVTAVLPDANAS